MNPPHNRCIGLIIAAGRGRRMGRTKQLVEWPALGGKRPLVAAAFDAICGVCDEMIVVLGHDSERVAAALGGRTFHRVTSDADAEMFASIRAGLAAAQAIDPSAVAVLQPGDRPEVSQATLDALAAAIRQEPNLAAMPEHAGRGGHPVFIPPNIASRLLVEKCQGGLNRFWAEHADLCQRVAVDDLGILINVDTPEQVPRL